MESSILKEINGEEFIFDYRRAIFWPRRNILIVSDLHWGKTQYLRQHGIAISDNIFEADLMRLSDLLIYYKARTLLVLGDLIHHENSMSKDVIEKIAWFRHEIPCELLLVMGNHDRFACFPESWGVVEEADFAIDQFYFSHDYNKKIKGFQFSGHVHPTIRLRSGFDSLRFPSFVLDRYFCLLPAFSELTGGQDVRIQKNQEALVLVQEGIEIFRR